KKRSLQLVACFWRCRQIRPDAEDTVMPPSPFVGDEEPHPAKERFYGMVRRKRGAFSKAPLPP
ncbi:hypothetical protein, partial [Desulfovibrio sp.]|uniref:hypothetical protein n=1 Tax=Desulfovibrio sp. TaxID=885 RepID=UPI003078795C